MPLVLFINSITISEQIPLTRQQNPLTSVRAVEAYNWITCLIIYNLAMTKVSITPAWRIFFILCSNRKISSSYIFRPCAIHLLVNTVINYDFTVQNEIIALQIIGVANAALPHL